MSILVELITAWETYNQEYEEHSVEEFCHYYLAQRKVEREEIKQDRQQKADHLLKVMGRITNMFTLYHRAAMAKTGLPSADSFYYLNGLNFLGEVRKTELINYLFVEYTTGMEAISRLINDDYISERPDQIDKRAKLIRLTAKGKRQLNSSFDYSSRVSEMIFSQVNEEAISLCLALLKPIEERHTRLLASFKGKGFDEMYNQVINSENL